MAEKKFSTGLAQIIAEADTTPNANVRVAANEYENAYALAQGHVRKASRLCPAD